MQKLMCKRLMWIAVEKQCALPMYFFSEQQFDICCSRSVMKGLLQLMLELRRSFCIHNNYRHKVIGNGVPTARYTIPFQFIAKKVLSKSVFSYKLEWYIIITMSILQ
jgi:hypothetical protein